MKREACIACSPFVFQPSRRYRLWRRRSHNYVTMVHFFHSKVHENSPSLQPLLRNLPINAPGLFAQQDTISIYFSAAVLEATTSLDFRDKRNWARFPHTFGSVPSKHEHSEDYLFTSPQSYALGSWSR